MVEPFSILGLVIITIIVLSVSHMMGFVLKALFYTLIVCLVLVIIFGVSLDQVINWGKDVVLWAL